MADALEAKSGGEDESVEETELELEETGVLELESSAAEEDQIPTL
mgnify:CR=1 FL=1